MTINLHIERLILDGLPVASEQGALVQQAVQRDLTRLLATGELENARPSGGTVYCLQTTGIQVAQEISPARLGEQIAAAVYGGLVE